jgi:FkbM family methyltransferase
MFSLVSGDQRPARDQSRLQTGRSACPTARLRARGRPSCGAPGFDRPAWRFSIDLDSPRIGDASRRSRNVSTYPDNASSADPSLSVLISPGDLERWSEERPLPMRLAQLWASHAPRGTSWVPRKLGRLFGRRWRCVVRTSDGAMLAVHPYNLDIYTAIVREGAWERSVVRTCCTVLKAGDVFYDVGANAGAVSMAVSTHFRGGVNIVAFEPQAELARLIAISARLNGVENVHVFRTLLGDRDGATELFIPSHSIHASMIARERRATAISAPIRTLDHLVYSGVMPPDAIKIDVEGAELQVLQGAERLLRERPPYLVFEADDNMMRFGYSREDLFSYLRKQADFTIFGIREDGLAPLHESLEDPETRDFLAVPPGRELPQ